MDSFNLNGKTALVLGIANRWSIAYAIAQALQEHGVRLVVTYQNERIGAEVRKLTSDWSNVLYLPCELTDEARSIRPSRRSRRSLGSSTTLFTALPLPTALSYRANSARFRAADSIPPWTSVLIP